MFHKVVYALIYAQVVVIVYFHIHWSTTSICFSRQNADGTEPWKFKPASLLQVSPQLPAKCPPNFHQQQYAALLTLLIGQLNISFKLTYPISRVYLLHHISCENFALFLTATKQSKKDSTGNVYVASNYCQKVLLVGSEGNV